MVDEEKPYGTILLENSIQNTWNTKTACPKVLETDDPFRPGSAQPF